MGIFLATENLSPFLVSKRKPGDQDPYTANDDKKSGYAFDRELRVPPSNSVCVDNVGEMASILHRHRRSLIEVGIP